MSSVVSEADDGAPLVSPPVLGLPAVPEDERRASRQRKATADSASLFRKRILCFKWNQINRCYENEIDKKQVGCHPGRRTKGLILPQLK